MAHESQHSVFSYRFRSKLPLHAIQAAMGAELAISWIFEWIFDCFATEGGCSACFKTLFYSLSLSKRFVCCIHKTVPIFEKYVSSSSSTHLHWNGFNYALRCSCFALQYGIPSTSNPKIGQCLKSSDKAYFATKYVKKHQQQSLNNPKAIDDFYKHITTVLRANEAKNIDYAIVLQLMVIAVKTKKHIQSHIPRCVAKETLTRFFL